MTADRLSSSSPLDTQRRRLLGWGLGAAGLAALGAAAPHLAAFAADAVDFIRGPKVPDVPFTQVSDHVHVIYAADGFPTESNQGMMSNITVVKTAKGLVVLDTGASVQIGEMVIRQLPQVSQQPVIAVFNSHYHGDHWLGNDAFVSAYGQDLPVYAMPQTREQIEGATGSEWQQAMLKWTNQSSAGTRIVAPNRNVNHGDLFDFGDVTLRAHHYGTAHTPADVCIEVVQDKLTHVGDVMMNRRIANMDDGSYPGSLNYMDKLAQNIPGSNWLPGHGHAGQEVMVWQRELFVAIWEHAQKAAHDMAGPEAAIAAAKADPRVASKAKDTAGWDNNIGKYISLAYLEAEQRA
ncbi:MBL fold metallo-hydrolase [Thiomonas intermedia]|uniref:MBL fold metallo-hydrolase n=1 Tax=Thiomonas intermedia TaxID=926 RepID=UPI0009A52E41|nr:MBL fold metallo-hydrolase [Thiomonas intermedia]